MGKISLPYFSDLELLNLVDFDLDLRMEVLNELVLDTRLGFGFNLGKVVGFARKFRVFYLLKRVRWN